MTLNHESKCRNTKVPNLNNWSFAPNFRGILSTSDSRLRWNFFPVFVTTPCGVMHRGRSASLDQLINLYIGSDFIEKQYVKSRFVRTHPLTQREGELFNIVFTFQPDRGLCSRECFSGESFVSQGVITTTKVWTESILKSTQRQFVIW